MVAWGLVRDMRLNLAVFSGIGISLFISACGGGGGGTATDSAALRTDNYLDSDNAEQRHDRNPGAVYCDGGRDR